MAGGIFQWLTLGKMATLAEDIELLRAENAALKAALATEMGEDASVPLGMRRGEWRVLGMLRRRQLLTHEAFSMAVEATSGNIVAPQYLSVRIHHLRHKLDHLGIRIRLQYGVGYYMDEVSKRKCDELFGPVEKAN